MIDAIAPYFEPILRWLKPYADALNEHFEATPRYTILYVGMLAGAGASMVGFMVAALTS